jgi:hypothetical protein
MTCTDTVIGTRSVRPTGALVIPWTRMSGRYSIAEPETARRCERRSVPTRGTVVLCTSAPDEAAAIILKWL